MARMHVAAYLALILLPVPLLAAAQALPELIDEEARRGRLREAGRQAEQLRNQIDMREQDRLRKAYPEAPTAISAPPPAPTEPAGRCDGFSRDMEAVIREEMRGGSPAVMEQLTARRQQIYLARQSAGC